MYKETALIESCCLFSCGIGKSLFPIPQKITLHRKNILKSLLLFFDQKTTLHFIYNFDMIVHNKSI